MNNQCKSISTINSPALPISSVPALYTPPISSVPALSYSTEAVDYSLLPTGLPPKFYKILNACENKGFVPLYFIISPTRYNIRAILSEANAANSGGFYLWYNLIAPKNTHYVGSSTLLYDRLSKSYYDRSTLFRTNMLIYNSILKYGYDNFILVIFNFYGDKLVCKTNMDDFLLNENVLIAISQSFPGSMN